ncbi:MAG TPA: hypothetical protein VM733_01750, partial [Thermoanaerobaculia bacterium]|nr:hypothetical protein [Thermoanaerobaculia bacterium]
MRTISLFLLFTLGQLQSYGPYARPWQGGNHSVTSARGSTLLAWSEKDASGHARIRVVMLDSSGRAISPIRTLPALMPSRDAILPAVGTDGDSFVVVWEETLGLQHTVAIALDHDGVAVGEPHHLTNDIPSGTVPYEAARVQWLGDSYGVRTAANASVRVGTDAAPMTTPPSAMPSAQITRTPLVGFGFSCCTYPPQHYLYSITWTSAPRSGFESIGQDAVLSEPYIAAAGERFVVVWTTRNLVNYRFTDEPARHVVDAEVDEFSRPRVDCQSTHCVIVYATKQSNVEGLILTHTNPNAAPTRFIAAASAAIEREPEVTMPGDARALITWRSTEADGEHLTGRPLVLPSKQRAVR